ncbi:hypothetical protein H849_24518, partial [Prescottella equi NBRC 101255 = C 7]
MNVCDSVATPLTTATGDPIGAPLSVNCTEPTAFDGFTVADKSTELPVVADPGAVTDNDVDTFGSTTVTDWVGA